MALSLYQFEIRTLMNRSFIVRIDLAVYKNIMDIVSNSKDVTQLLQNIKVKQSIVLKPIATNSIY